MSNLVSADALPCQAQAADACFEALPTRDAELGGGLTIRRALPHRQRRLVGAWCFLDHFGPLPLEPNATGMRVGPHPHIGLQTVSWLFEGEILHRDSLGYTQLIRPGQLNLMTAGRGIAHSEETPAEHGARLHGLQFWVALPEAHKNTEPTFAHHPEVPRITRDGMAIQLFAGQLFGEHSPAQYFSPLTGFDLQLTDSGARQLPLNPGFEYAVLLTEGACELDGQPCTPGQLYYLGRGRDHLTITNKAPARGGIFGGAPLGETLILWWNFVARTQQEVATARADWEAAHERFGAVRGYDGARLAAPELSGRFKAS